MMTTEGDITEKVTAAQEFLSEVIKEIKAVMKHSELMAQEDIDLDPTQPTA